MNRQEWQYRNKKKKSMDCYNRHNSKQHPHLYASQKVYVQHKKRWQREPGMIHNSGTSPRSYIVESENGSIHGRNRQFIRLAKRDSILDDRHDQLPIIDANASQKEPHTIVDVPSLHHTLQSRSLTDLSQIMIPEEQTPPIMVKQLTTQFYTSRPYRPIPEPRRFQHCIKIPQRLDL